MIKAAKLAACIAALCIPLQMTGAAVAAAASNAIPAAAQRAGAGPSTGLTFQEILRPAPDSWPTYSGDYSGRRYSPLRLINRQTVQNLQLAWATTLPSGPGEGVNIGGDPRGNTAQPGNGNARGALLMVDGVIYAGGVNNVWAMDARSGKILWRFYWKHRGGTTIGNRGVGIWGDYLFFETPDNYLVSLDRLTGKERWHTEIAPFEEQFFSTPAPVVVGNHVIVGTGNDHEMPGRLQSFDPVTGERQWVFWTVPMNPGDPGLDTWKDLDAARHGGAQPWVPGSYDPETNLYIFGTSEPKPGYFARPRTPATYRGVGDPSDDALYSCSIIAVDVATGKMKWYYQTSPSETHDWDSAQTPVLADIVFQGKPRKVVLTASRNGYFFVIDRITGEHLLTSKFNDNSNWAYPQLNQKGQPERIPEKDHLPNGALVSTPNGGSVNWPPPAYNPDVGLFYIPVNEGFAMYYTNEADPRGSIGLGGKSESGVMGGGGYLKAIDPKTGRTAWKVSYPTVNASGVGPGGGSGMLTTAGGLLFAAGSESGLVARDAATGRPLWNSRWGANNAPQTYMLDGKQWLLVSSGSQVHAYKLP